MKLDDVKAYYKEFYGASKGELSVVGDFDAGSTKAVIAQMFDGWVSKAPYTRMVSKRLDPPAIRKVFNTPDKENAVYSSKMTLALREDDNI